MRFFGGLNTKMSPISDLEAAILQVQDRLFGWNRFYLDVKNRIGTKGYSIDWRIS